MQKSPLEKAGVLSKLFFR
uniref:CFTR protein n=1 Tax=Oryctolagus cuniculus TaxID=9986 RepID=P79214_RABIT|nr:CFTR [Oryctolagus cuniculus]